MALLCWAAPSSYAQFSFFENFDGMGPSGALLPAGWEAGSLVTAASAQAMSPYAGNGKTIRAMTPVVDDGSGSSTDAKIMNLGTAGFSDRALGSFSRSTYGDQIMQVAVVNNTGLTFSQVTLSYWGEQWNQSQGTSASGPEKLRVLASTTSGLAGFTYLSGFDFTAPKQGQGTPSGVALNGNDPANRAFITGTVTFGSPVPNGQTFWLRWHDWNESSTLDHFLAIDDVKISIIPEPGTVSTLLLGLGALILWQRRRQ